MPEASEGVAVDVRKVLELRLEANPRVLLDELVRGLAFGVVFQELQDVLQGVLDVGNSKNVNESSPLPIGKAGE